MNPVQDLALLDIQGPIATITLNNPKRLNAFDAPTVQALRDVLRIVARRDDLRVVILTGAGRAFCAGGDLRSALEQHPERPGDFFLDLAEVFHQCVQEMRTMPKPVIAALNGPAAGGGFSLALACDLRVAAKSAFLQQAYTSNGLCVDGGGTVTLPRLVGLARALEIAFLDERISADQALELGLVNRVVSDEALMETAEAMATKMTKKSAFALAKVKALMSESLETSLETQLEAERQGLAA